MTIRKKLQISNILMLVIPVGVIALAAFLCVTFLGNHYFDSLEDMFESDNGLYSAQSLTFSYWGDFESDPAKAAAGLQGELSAMDFHVSVTRDGARFSSNLTEEDEKCIESLTEGSLEACENLSLTKEGAALIRQTKTAGGAVWVLTAVRPQETGAEGFSGSYLRTYFTKLIGIVGAVTLGIILITNFILTHWVSQSILKPLKLLQEGARRIEEGELDFQLRPVRKDEIGEVCQDFDSMRGRLQEAALSKLEFENYRRELLAGISHDLRTPLTSIKGYADGLLEGIANTEEKRQRYYRAIRQRAGDMEMLADSLSAFSRLEAEKVWVKPECRGLAGFVKGILNEYEVEAEKKGILFINEIEDPDIRVRLDGTEMKRVFINLFENSVKYRTAEKSVIRLSGRLQGEFVEIRVADDGPGVPEKELKDIFNSFYRGDQSRTNPGNGSGLGLAVVRQIVEGHGGRVWAENGSGGGLVIAFWLPVCEEEQHEKDTDCRG